MFANVAKKLNNYRKYRKTVEELSRLSDRELYDLGIGRSEIRGIARGGVYAR